MLFVFFFFLFCLVVETMVDCLSNELGVASAVTSSLLAFYRTAKLKRTFGATDIADEAFRKRARADDDAGGGAAAAAVPQDATFDVQYDVELSFVCCFRASVRFLITFSALIFRIGKNDNNFKPR